MVQVVPALWRVHRVQVVQRCKGFEASGPGGVLALVLWSCVPLLLPALLLCARCVALEICLYSRFKGVFSGFWGACVGLYCFDALRGLWGFCVREVFGGFGA